MSVTKYFPPRVTADTWPLLLFDVWRDTAVDQTPNKARFDAIPWWDGDLYRITWRQETFTQWGSHYNALKIRLFFPVAHTVRLRVEWSGETSSGDDFTIGSISARLYSGDPMSAFPFDASFAALLSAEGGDAASGNDEVSDDFGPGLFVVRFACGSAAAEDLPKWHELIAEIEWSPATP